MKKRFLLSILMMINVFVGFSQPGNPGGNPDNPVPITGIEILIAIGSLFGASRFLKGKNKSKKEL